MTDFASAISSVTEMFITDEDKLLPTMDFTYDYGVVLLSFLVAIVASHTAFHLLGRIIAAQDRRTKIYWLIISSASLGCGIWSMHFIGMLAVQMDHGIMRYDPLITALSSLGSIGASALAFYFVSLPDRSRLQILLAGVGLGSGIGIMHYSGMAAMQMDMTLKYDPLLFGLSIVIAVCLSIVTLNILLYTVRKKEHNSLKLVIPAIIMGCSICLMHYTGMEATNFILDDKPRKMDGIDLEGIQFVLIIAGVTFNLLSLAWISANADRTINNKNRKIRRSERALKKLIDTAMDPMITFDETGTINSQNFAAIEKFGYQNSEILKKNIDLLFAEDALYAAIEPEEACPRNFDHKNRITTSGHLKNGEECIFEISIGRSKHGQHYVFTAIIRDITEKEKAACQLRQNQEELKYSKQHLSAVTNSVKDAIISIKGDGQIISLNTAAEKMFGYSNMEILGQSITTLMTPEERKYYADLSMEFDKDCTNFLGLRWSLGKAHNLKGLTKSADTFPAEIDATAVELNGEIIFVGVCRDMTEQYRAEEERSELERELRQAHKMESLGTLAGGIAHEINTPVQYVGDNIRFLQDAFNDLMSVNNIYSEVIGKSELSSDMNEKISTCLDNIDIDFLKEEVPASLEQSQSGVERIRNIVQGIKEFSFPETKEKTAVDINKAIETTVTVTSNQWKYAADINLQLEENMAPVPCLGGQFNQIILNLIVNAAHAIEDKPGDEKGLITIKTETKGDHAEVCISDTGTGMTTELIEKIFDPFFTTKDPGRGTGQGLAISHSIITNKLGGTVFVKSTPGEGSSFYIRIPFEDKQEKSEKAA